MNCIVSEATTLDEYRKYIEKDPALERRFQQVLAEEPTVEDTISILRGLKERFEIYHGVNIHDRAIVADQFYQIDIFRTVSYQIKQLILSMKRVQQFVQKSILCRQN